MATDPRKLVEITKYRNMLDARDAIQSIITDISGQTAEQLAENLKVTVSVTLKKDGATVSNGNFNTYLAEYVKSNILTITPNLAAYVDSLVASNKAEAETEAGLLGMNSTSSTVPAPTIISDGTATATIGAAFSYDIVADNDSGSGITSCTYSATGLQAWMSIDANSGAITGTVPDDATEGDSFTMTVKVTTNGGEDTKDVTVTYAASGEE